MIFIAPNSPADDGGGSNIGGVTEHTRKTLDELKALYPGLFRGDNFASVSEAGVAGMLRIRLLYGDSNKIEYGFSIYRDSDGRIQIGGFCTSGGRGVVHLELNAFFRNALADGSLLGWGHNHPRGERFSEGDKVFSGDNSVPGFVITPSIRTLRYDVPDMRNYTSYDKYRGYAPPQGTVTELMNEYPANDLNDIISYYRK